MQDPLKQGLKLCFVVVADIDPFKDSNARSIKTRIETCVKVSVPEFYRYIRMQDPLKQGLKHPQDPSRVHTPIQIRMQDPLKQGLKHIKKLD